MKKLNNKGFTLIELLAVVVILAVVMGIAMTSVLSAMNKSRGGSLEDSAMTIAQAFNQKYTESLVGGVPSNVYGDVLGTGYNFQSDATYYLDASLANEFNITEKGYAFYNSKKGVNENGNTADDASQLINVTKKMGETTNAVYPTEGIQNSFVTFDASAGKFVVCMFANRGGSYYVDNFKTIATEDGTPGTDNIKVDGITTDTKKLVAAADTMYACSNGEKSWK